MHGYWWVNHKQNFRRELAGEYLWSPKRNRNASNSESYNNMLRASPGDVVLSFADAAVRAVGVVLGRAREAPDPGKFKVVAVQSRTDLGWQVPVRFKELERALRPKEHAAVLSSVLPRKYSPIRAGGEANQGVYLAALPEGMTAKLRELLGGQIEEAVAAITASTGGALEDDVAEERIHERADIDPTAKLNLVRARRGQGLYRTNLERIERGCRVTGVIDRRYLRASHIKPWRNCDDLEKVDGFNGLLLSPHIKHLFDRGHLSFSDSGDLLISRFLNPEVLRSWGLAGAHNVGAFRMEQCTYLEYHRREVFEQLDAGGGRLSALPSIDPRVPTIGATNSEDQ
jgi:putative restriction endonuclease